MNTKHVLNRATLVLMLATLLITSLITRGAQAEQMSAREHNLAPKEAMEDTWDAFFEEGLEEFGVNGAVMVAVNVNGDGAVFSKGYGYADAANNVPFDPQNTILRSGSIAKSLTATAVFQLMEQGKLDLDADINNYLTRFKVEGNFPEPVTARQLINMTGGFDTRWIGIRAASLSEIIPLEDYLAQRMPPRVLPPGRYRRYNDHELALAGYLVQVVSGMHYEEYVRKNIFEPLEMSHSSIYLPDDQLGRAARGYPAGGGREAYPLSYYYLNTAPGAGFNTTATDMAHFMSAHLRNGRYTRSDGTEVRILEEATAAEMHATGFTYDPHLPGQANTFDEMSYNGQRYLRKQGGAPGMQNYLMLLPSEEMGFYLFINSDGTGLRNRWADKVLETYLAAPDTHFTSTSLETSSNAPIAAGNYSGDYLEVSDMTSSTTMIKMQALFDPDLWLQVKANPDGSLRIGNGQYRAVSKELFQNVESGGYTAFELDEAGKASFVFQWRTPYQRVSRIETPLVQIGMLVLALLAFVVGAVAAAGGLIKRKSNGRGLAGLISVLNLLFVAGLVVVLLPVATGVDTWQFSFEPSLELRAVLAVPVITALLSVVLLVQNASDWRTKRYSHATRLLNTLVLAGMAAFLFFLNTWNLLGWRF